jgi:WD40 repeat protein
VQVWNAKTGSSIFTYSNHLSPINAVAWSPDGQYLASGGDDKIVHVWKLPGR